MSTASKVRQDKDEHPERYCPAPKCLWRTGGGFCPKHAPAPIMQPEQQATPGLLRPVRGVRKHREAIFLKAGDVFVAKVYGHDGAPAEANADRLIRGWNAAEQPQAVSR